MQQADHVKQHACSDCHKLVELAFLRPDAPMHLCLQKEHSDDKLLHGAGLGAGVAMVLGNFMDICGAVLSPNWFVI